MTNLIFLSFLVDGDELLTVETPPPPFFSILILLTLTLTFTHSITLSFSDNCLSLILFDFYVFFFSILNNLIFMLIYAPFFLLHFSLKYLLTYLTLRYVIHADIKNHPILSNATELILFKWVYIVSSYFNRFFFFVRNFFFKILEMVNFAFSIQIIREWEL